MWKANVDYAHRALYAAYSTTGMLHVAPETGQSVSHAMHSMNVHAHMLHARLQCSAQECLQAHMSSHVMQLTWMQGMGIFDWREPDGQYALDMSQPAHHQVARELLLLAGQQGSATWVNPRLDGKPFNMSQVRLWLSGAGHIHSCTPALACESLLTYGFQAGNEMSTGCLREAV